MGHFAPDGKRHQQDLGVILVAEVMLHDRRLSFGRLDLWQHRGFQKKVP